MLRKKGKPLRVLVTAGPTWEWVDPVRFLSNPSTGVMGYAIAKAARQAGCRTTLLSGPTQLAPVKGVRALYFESAGELKHLLEKEFPKHDILFMTAAVGDYAPASVKKSKIKRKSALTVRFRATPDIVRGVSAIRRKGQIIAGFCLETEDLAKNALAKLKTKRLDFIVANYLGRGTKPFGNGRTNVMVYDRWQGSRNFRGLTKPILAERLFRYIRERLDSEK